jgi:hypothetical protein
MALRETITGQKRPRPHLKRANESDRVRQLSWDPAANSVLISLRDGVATVTEVEDGGVIVERNREGAALNLEILCVRQGLGPKAIETVVQYCPAAADALYKLTESLPESLVQIPLA